MESTDTQVTTEEIAQLRADLERLKAEKKALERQVTRLHFREGIKNLTAVLGECDYDCATGRGADYCTCGAQKFRAKFGPGKA